MSPNFPIHLFSQLNPPLLLPILFFLVLFPWFLTFLSVLPCISSSSRSHHASLSGSSSTASSSGTSSDMSASSASPPVNHNYNLPNSAQPEPESATSSSASQSEPESSSSSTTPPATPLPFLHPQNTHPMVTRSKCGIVQPRLHPTLLITELDHLPINWP